jgi:hypothetical protein
VEAGNTPIEPDALHDPTKRGLGQRHYGRRGFLLLMVLLADDRRQLLAAARESDTFGGPALRSQPTVV